MVVGIGIDSAQIMRIEKSMQKEAFLKKVFSAEEQTLFIEHSQNRKNELATGCFAAKEAFLKAAGVGLGGFALQEISLLRKPSGQPYFHLSGAAKAYCEIAKITPLISLTHEAGIVTAFVLFENEQPRL